MYYKKLKGEKVYLSPVDITNETPLMTKWLNEDEDLVYQNGFYRSVFNEDKTKALLEKWNEGPYMFSIVTNDDEFIGHISLFNMTTYSVTLGIYIASEYRHHGYGTEAMKLIKDYIFNELGYKNIHLEVFSYNKRAIKFYLALGYEICGIWHDERYAHGEYHDIILMEMRNK